jgi:hypothetical protein
MHALLSEFSPVRDTHDLIPVDLHIRLGDSLITMDKVLSAIADGTIEPESDMGDDPMWAKAMASPKWEYWIAGG